ncbi:VWA domain-containing protein [Pelolinea submarina]|uniref:Mg-chelatase subunit ChlD n=1 Tax=Pelolinea submarina TaxID=913107 RepID=A0A3E0AIY1_9CHLR|nr:VWA domain-containing protein [Pelolinea submarina]REG11605.1 Mg-chelatase subunit ChlD [Pelolinea submarina]
MGEESGDLPEQEGDVPLSPKDIFDQYNANWWEGGQKIKVGEAFTPRRLDTPLDKIVRNYGGRRSRTKTDRKRGRYIQARPANGRTNDLAFDATIRAAAPFQKKRKEEENRYEVAFHVKPSDYMRKVRVRRAANMILFVVDASWSMAVAERMSATKGAIMSLLTDAYQRRDRVGLIVFQKDRATLVMPPTNSVQLAQRALSNIPVGGKTPLSAGLALAQEILEREAILHPEVMPLLIVLTDGAGNVAMGANPPLEESHQIADEIAKRDVPSIVINMESATYDQGLANDLANHLNAPCLSITDLRAEHLYMAVRQASNELRKGEN